jgi:hypothetical protein
MLQEVCSQIPWPCLASLHAPQAGPISYAGSIFLLKSPKVHNWSFQDTFPATSDALELLKSGIVKHPRQNICHSGGMEGHEVSQEHPVATGGVDEESKNFSEFLSIKDQPNKKVSLTLP